MKKSIPVFLVLILTLLACTFTPAIGVGESGSVLFQDDFASSSSGWFTNAYDSGTLAEYSDGGFRIYVTEQMSDLIAQANQSFPADVAIDVDAAKQGGVDNNDMGVICRMQDLENFYFFLISSDGFANIGMYKDGAPTYFIRGWEQTDVIAPGNATNHIRATCVGSSLTLYANGIQVAQVTDSTFVSGGDVGLMAGTFDVGGTDILFDNFVVTRP